MGGRWVGGLVVAGGGDSTLKYGSHTFFLFAHNAFRRETQPFPGDVPWCNIPNLRTVVSGASYLPKSLITSTYRRMHTGASDLAYCDNSGVAAEGCTGELGLISAPRSLGRYKIGRLPARAFGKRRIRSGRLLEKEEIKIGRVMHQENALASFDLEGNAAACVAC